MGLISPYCLSFGMSCETGSVMMIPVGVSLLCVCPWAPGHAPLINQGRPSTCNAAIALPT
jgi:hypothetical protein